MLVVICTKIKYVNKREGARKSKRDDGAVVAGEDDVVDGIHDVSEEVGVGGIGVMDIDLLVLAPVQSHEPRPEKVYRLIVVSFWAYFIKRHNKKR